MVTLLFPGRHHMLTKFQHDYLERVIKEGFQGKKITRIVFAVTSSDHSNTRRNPVPFYLRALAIEKFSRDLSCKTKIYSIPDIKPTDKFAEYLIHQIEYQYGDKINPKNAILVCSTPSVLNLFKKLGFDNLPAELIDEKKEVYASLRPYEVIELLVKSHKNWRNSAEWKKYASLATQEIYQDYNLGDLIVELFEDSLISDDAELTETRDYQHYARAMDQNIEFKFNDIKPFVTQGKIVDAGCGTGNLIWHLSNQFPESDIIGIEATRKFYEFCKTQQYPNPFVFFYRRNILNQNFKKNTVNTFIYSSVLHEIYSYSGKKSLIKVLKNTYNQLAPKGRVVIRDVVGPENPEKKVLLELNETDGKNKGTIKEISTYDKFYCFAKDFLPRKIKFKVKKINNKNLIELRLQDAYEFISKMNYIDNWQSEMHEEFGFWSFSQWEKKLKEIGFEIIQGSHSFQSEYIINNMYKGKAKLYEFQQNQLIELNYPPTNMILVGEKQNLV